MSKRRLILMLTAIVFMLFAVALGAQAQSRANLPPDLQALVNESLKANPRRPCAPPGPWMTPSSPSAS
jgi:hypothetical protein